MSLSRTVYYCSVVCGWMALLGWLFCEMIVMRARGPSGGHAEALVVGAVVGAMIGAGFNLAAGWTNPNLAQLSKRAGIGLLAGAVGGGLGAVIGNVMYDLNLPRAFGFMVLGIGVGIADGIYERSVKKIRNGAIGGAIGGVVGGLLFAPLAGIFQSASGMSSRATAFVLLGLCVGGLIGACHLILREAWITVLDGYRTGRQLILSDSVTALGRADHLPLPFLGPASKNLEPIHAQITRLSDGRYQLADNKSAIGTYVNHQRVETKLLADGDIIKLGANLVRFNERVRKGTSDSNVAAQPSGSAVKPLPKPPSPPPRKSVPTAQSPSPPPQPPTGSSGKIPTSTPQPGSRLPPPPPPPPTSKK